MNKSIRNYNLISNILQEWYLLNKRQLPWREDANPYRIWVSEVILQQTKVNQGLHYFTRFINQFPDIASLANAPEDTVMKMWQGLGYYSRAANLHAAAKQIVQDFGGEFPRHYSDILSLRGIGPYTAAAIASIAYNKPFAVVDGNVYRVLSRLFTIDQYIDTASGKKFFAELAQSLLDKHNAGNHNQALMDFGAMICIPIQPKCNECPLQNICMANMNQTVLEFPKKRGKTKIKERFFHYFYVEQADFTFIKKRVGDDIWKNLYEFPLIETEKPQEMHELMQNPHFHALFRSAKTLSISHSYFMKHILTHRTVYIHFYIVQLTETDVFDAEKQFLRIATADLHNYPVARPIHKWLEK